MAKYVSGRQKNIKVGITSYSENLTSLEVIGGSIFTGESSSELVRISQTGTGPAFVVEDSSNPDSTPFVITSDGRVAIGLGPSGVGTTYKLEIDGNGNGGDVRFVSGGQGDLIFSHSNLVSNIRSAGTIQLGLGANGGDAIRINLNNDVGIGTSIPTSKLHVIGDGYFTGIVTAESLNINSTSFFSGAITGTISTAIYAVSSGIATYAITVGIASYATTSGIATYATSSGIATYATTTGYATTAGIATETTRLQTSRTFEITGDIIASPINFDGTSNVSLAATIQPNSVGLGTDTFGDYVKSISGTTGQIIVSDGSGEGSTPIISFSPNPTIGGNVTIGNDLQVNNNLNITGNITVGGTTAYIISQDFRVTDADIVLGFTTDSYGNDASTDTTANHGGISVASTEGNPLVQLINVSIGESSPVTYKKFMWFKSGAFSGLNTDAWLSNYAIGIGSTQFPSGTRLAAGSVQFTEYDLAVVRNINASGIITGTLSNNLIMTTSGIGISGISTYNNSGPITFTINSNATSSNTANTLVSRDVFGNFSAGTITANLTGTASTASFATTSFNLYDAANITIGTISASRLSGTYSINISGNSNYSNNSGIATNIKGGTGGNVPYQSATDTTTFVTNGSSGQVLLFDGSIPYWGNVSSASGSFGGITIRDEGTIVGTANSITTINIVGNNVTATATSGSNGISTITIADYVSVAGVATYATSAGIATYATSAGIATYATSSGISTYATSAGIATNIKGGTGGNVPYQSATDTTTFVTNGSSGQVLLFDGSIPYWGNVSSASGSFGGITIRDEGTIVGTANSITTLNFVGNNVTATATSGSNGISTITIADYVSVAGVATYATSAGISTYATSTGIATDVIGGIASVTQLDVSGVSTISVNSSSTALRITQTGTGNALIVEDSTNPDSTPFIVNTSGLVGVGTTNPTSSLHVVGDTFITGILTANRIFSNIYGEFTGGGISGTNIVGTALSISGISTLGSVQISSGIVTATSGVVTYYGDGSKLSGISAGLTISDDTSTNSTYYIGIANTITGVLPTLNVSSTKLTFNPSNGNLIVGGTVTANSDKKLKVNIKQIENALSKVLSLRGVEYDRIDNEEHQIGVIAQEVEEIIPEVVYPKHSKSETKSVAYSNLVALLIEAIKEQNKRIDELERKLGG